MRSTFGPFKDQHKCRGMHYSVGRTNSNTTFRKLEETRLQPWKLSRNSGAMSNMGQKEHPSGAKEAAPFQNSLENDSFWTDS
jgi:hypothetical protein